jgi:hypothetical protein
MAGWALRHSLRCLSMARPQAKDSERVDGLPASFKRRQSAHEGQSERRGQRAPVCQDASRSRRKSRPTRV